MKFTIKHEIKGRMRIHLVRKNLTYEQADTLQYYLQNKDAVKTVKIYERTADAVIFYEGDRERILQILSGFSFEKTELPAGVSENGGRRLNARYKEKLVQKAVMHYGAKLLMPYPVRAVWTVVKSAGYLMKGVRALAKRRLDVSVLDAMAIGVSVLRNDMNTASSVMFLLGVGELLEEWTHKKSVDDLARTMSLNVGKVWLATDGGQVLVSVSDIKLQDRVVVHMGNVIPFDGVVCEGEAMINQASFTGESAPVRKTTGNYVYAGTVVEEGEVTICVKAVGNTSRYDKIVKMIEESEKLKSSMESKAEHLADGLVPYTLAGTILTYILTGNAAKALSVLMVDFSCALKLAMPLCVLSAIRTAGHHNITVKGGKFLENISQADTIVFDKTGTLTKATPRVAEIVPFCDEEPDELLRIAACLEEHFPHSMAKAVTRAARERGLVHEEMHTKVEYVVAHGISTTINGEKVIIGSYHFVFEDEKCKVEDARKGRFEELNPEYSHLYLAKEGMLAAVICIEDPVREEARAVIDKLRNMGISKIVMMTGDSERTAAAIARKVGVDEYASEVLPEDKAAFVEKEKQSGRTVVMIGDGINDSPALSAADVGIAISDGAEIAREIADVVIEADDLHRIVTLKSISDSMVERIRWNYRQIVGINAGLIGLGVTGIIQPTTSALLHNTSTLLISVNSMRDRGAE